MASVRYSYTITLKPVAYKNIAEVQYDHTYNEVCRIFNNLNLKYTLVAECTKSMNVHYHGTVQFKNVHLKSLKLFIDAFRNHRLIGFIKIVQITDEPGWIDYISKDLPLTVHMMGRRPIIKDDFDYFTPQQYADYGTEW